MLHWPSCLVVICYHEEIFTTVEMFVLTHLSSAIKHSISHVNMNLLTQSLTLKEKSQVISQRIDIYTV